MNKILFVNGTMRVYVKIGNVFFASRWFADRQGILKEGEANLSYNRLMARLYSDMDTIKRDAMLLGVDLERIEIVPMKELA